jgi:hypothetical protein
VSQLDRTQLATVTISPSPLFVKSGGLVAQPSKKKPALVDLVLGPLPTDAINRTLGLDLEPGDVIFTVAAQAHAFRSHPDDFPRCLPHVGPVVEKPSYMGDDFKNPGKIELVTKIAALGSGLLVAIVVELDEHGRYNVSSLYPIGGKKIENRRQSGHLKIPKWK